MADLPHNSRLVRREPHPPKPPSILSHVTYGAASTASTTPPTDMIMKAIARKFGSQEGIEQLQANPEIKAAFETVAGHFHSEQNDPSSPIPVPAKPWPAETAVRDIDKITDNILYWQTMVVRYAAEHRRRGIKNWTEDWTAYEKYAIDTANYWFARRYDVVEEARKRLEGENKGD